MFGGNKMVIWGAGQTIVRAHSVMQFVDYIVDKNEKLWGMEYMGKKVYSPDDLLKETQPITVLITSQKYEESIRKDINQLGIKVVIESICEMPATSSYGQFGEDAIIEKILTRVRINTIRYIDIGLPSPIVGSNTYLFYTKGSRGICVEPNPDVAQLLKEKRQGDIIVNKGVGALKDSGNVLKYHRFENDPALNTFDDGLMENRLKSGFQLKDTIDIEVISLNELVEKHMPEGPDYISIDTEGFEYRILKDFDFSRYDVKVICLEKGDSKVYELLEENGFKTIADTSCNRIYGNAMIYDRIYNWEKYAGK